MFVLFKRLQHLRRAVALPAPASPGSLALRHVDCGSCNGCEHELTNAAGPHYDLDRFGLSVVASPRHADVLLITGTITTRMVEPLRLAYAAMPEPRIVAALGDCALGVGVIAEATQLAGPVEEVLPVDIRIPGCPPTAAAIAEALVTAIDLAR
jgi:Ni,Fe-hydrogenase III small subunit